MLTDREISKIANEAYNEFITNFLIECDIEVISLNKYFSHAEKIPAIQELIKERKYKTTNYQIITIVACSLGEFLSANFVKVTGGENFLGTVKFSATDKSL